MWEPQDTDGKLSGFTPHLVAPRLDRGPQSGRTMASLTKRAPPEDQNLMAWYTKIYAHSENI